MRAVAILFLLYTGVDLASPQVCGEELLLVPANTPLTTVKAGIPASTNQPIEINGTETDRREPLPKQPTDCDEDCFCCCAHVLPGTIFINAAAQEFRSPTIILAQVWPPSPLLPPASPPPRAA